LEEVKDNHVGYREHATLVDTLRTSYKMILEELPSEKYYPIKQSINSHYVSVLTEQSVDFLEKLSLYILNEIKETEKFKTDLLDSGDYKGYHKALESYKRLQDVFKDVEKVVKNYKSYRKEIGNKFCKIN